MLFSKIRFDGLTNIDFSKQAVATTEKFLLKGVDGLGPPPIDLSIARGLYGPGVYKTRRPQLRQVVLRVGLNPAWSTGETVSDLRTLLYGLITPGGDDVTKMILMNGATVITTNPGYVSKMEINPFAKDPEVQITFDCLDPHLIGPQVATTPASKSAPVVVNTGNAKTGFYFNITMTGSVSSLVLGHPNGDSITLTYPFISGDSIIINTVPGGRVATRTRSAVTIDLMQYLDAASRFFELDPGSNTMSLNTTSFNWGSGFIWFPRFWGI